MCKGLVGSYSKAGENGAPDRGCQRPVFVAAFNVTALLFARCLRLGSVFCEAFCDLGIVIAHCYSRPFGDVHTTDGTGEFVFAIILAIGAPLDRNELYVNSSIQKNSLNQNGRRALVEVMGR